MTDQVVGYDALNTQFAGGVPDAITPAMLRNLVRELAGDYALLKLAPGAVSLASGAALTGWTAGVANGALVSGGTNATSDPGGKLTILAPGYFLVAFCGAVQVAAAGLPAWVNVYKNGAPIAAPLQLRQNVVDIYTHVSLVGLASLAAADTLTVNVTHSSGAGQLCGWLAGSLSAFRVH